MLSALLIHFRMQAKRLGSSHFLRNVAVVAMGIATAQAISLSFMPFLTRLYGPEAFGSLAAFMAVVNIITPLATLGYANAIVMPATEEDATAVARLSLVCAIMVGTLVLIFVYILEPHLAEWTSLEDSPGFLYLIPVSLFIGALLSVANQTAVREELFKPKTSSYVISTFLINIGKLAGGLLSPYGLMLILLTLMGQAFNYFILLARVPRKGAFLVRRWFGTDGIREAAIEYRSFSFYHMPQSVINAASIGLPVMLLSTFSGPAVAGQYSITLLVLGAPVVLIGQSIGEVFYPKITTAIRDRACNAFPMMIKATLLLSGLALIPFTLVILFGPALFSFMLGDKWRLAGEFARWIAPWFACILATRAILASFPALRLQPYMLFQEVLSITMRPIALFLGLSYWQSDLVAVALFSLVGITLMVLLAAVGLLKLRNESRKWSNGIFLDKSN